MSQILYSTTRQWNPGDEIILRGVRHLLNKIAPGHNPVIWNRHPSIRPGNTSLDNSFDTSRHSLDSIDYVVFAGSPEWTGARNVPLCEAILESDARCSFIGIGSASTNRLLEPATRQVLDTRADVVITRDQATLASLARHSLTAQLLPCPSIFSFPVRQGRLATHKIALNYQGTRMPWQSLSPAVANQCFELYRLLMTRFNCTVICNYIDELDEASKIFPRTCLRYSFDSAEYASFFREVDLVVGTRLHSCLGAIACGTPAMLLGTESDLRLRGAAATVPVLRTGDVVSTDSIVAQIESLDARLESQKIISWIDNVEALYQPCIEKIRSSYPNKKSESVRATAPTQIAYAKVQDENGAKSPLSVDLATFANNIPVKIETTGLAQILVRMFIAKLRSKFSIRRTLRAIRRGTLTNSMGYKS